MMLGRDFEVRREHYRDLHHEALCVWQWQSAWEQSLSRRVRRQDALRALRSVVAMFFL